MYAGRIQTFAREGAKNNRTRKFLGHAHFCDHAHKMAVNKHNGCQSWAPTHDAKIDSNKIENHDIIIV